MVSKIAGGLGCPGSRTLDAPAANGKVIELPKPYAKKILGAEKHTSVFC